MIYRGVLVEDDDDKKQCNVDKHNNLTYLHVSFSIDEKLNKLTIVINENHPEHSGFVAYRQLIFVVNRQVLPFPRFQSPVCIVGVVMCRAHKSWEQEHFY